ncbi:MAG: response regulator [Verrucomicrobiales bacterium]
MNQKTRVVLVEDHPEYRETVQLALKRTSDLTLVGEFGTAERALRSLQRQWGEQQPDLILLDLALPGMGGLEALPQFLSVLPEVRIIVLTQSEREQDVLRAIALGASGYLLKSSRVKQITDGIRTVVEGGASLDADVAGVILDTLRTKLPKDEAADLLSPRELEVLSLIAQGLLRKQIADQLGIATSTVVTHIAHIYEKLNVQNAPEAVAKAFSTGILPVDKHP